MTGPADPDGGVDAPTDAVADAQIDATTDAAGTVGCLDPGNGTTFPSGAACNGWGTAFSTSAMVQNAGGRLTITPSSNLVTAGGCVHAEVPFAAPGVLAEIDRTVQGASARTLLELEGTGLAIGVEDSTMVARAGGAVIASAPFTLPAMRWWRMRPDAGGVAFEVSADGLTWSLLGRTALAAPATAPLRVVGETLAGEPAPGSARFLAINLCP